MLITQSQDARGRGAPDLGNIMNAVMLTPALAGRWEMSAQQGDPGPVLRDETARRLEVCFLILRFHGFLLPQTFRPALVASSLPTLGLLLPPPPVRIGDACQEEAGRELISRGVFIIIWQCSQ